MQFANRILVIDIQLDRTLISEFHLNRIVIFDQNKIGWKKREINEGLELGKKK